MKYIRRIHGSISETEKSILYIIYRNNKRNNDSENAYKSKIVSLSPFNSSLKRRLQCRKQQTTGINQKTFEIFFVHCIHNVTNMR
jgi:hypothetical protein